MRTMIWSEDDWYVHFCYLSSLIREMLPLLSPPFCVMISILSVEMQAVEQVYPAIVEFLTGNDAAL